MICDIDIGNSFIKWRFCNTSKVYRSADYVTLLDMCLSVQPRRVRVASVVSREKYSELFSSLLHNGCQVEFAEVQQSLGGVRHAYADSSRLGVDRWLALLAAHQKHSNRNLVVVSAGTALTVDFIELGGAHLGGMIVPGFAAAQAALLSGAQGVVFDAGMELEKNWQLGDSTLNCVKHGFSALYHGFFESVVSKAVDSMVDPKIIITGGGAADVERLLPEICEHVEDASLVLDGLAIAMP